MHLTVIVPTWKRVAKLRACLESLERQTVLPDLVLLTVRPEDEETAEFLRERRSGNLPLKVLPVTVPGVVFAENEAIKTVLAEAITDIVTFMDDDAIAFPEWIFRIKEFFTVHPKAAALGGPDIILSEPWSYHDVKVEKVGLVTGYGKVIGNHHRKSQGLRTVDVLKGVNMSVRRSYLTPLDGRLQGSDPAKGNGVFWELDLCFAVKAKGGEIYFDSQLLIQHDSNHAHFSAPHVVASTAHNLTFVMLKHLRLAKKIVFLAYSLFVGNGHIRGFLKTLAEVIRHRSLEPLTSFFHSMKGFFGGITSYLLNR